MSTALGRIAVAVVTMMLLGACGPAGGGEKPASPAGSVVPLAELSPLRDPKGYTGPSTATLAQRKIEPVADNPVQELPTTVVSHHRAGDITVTVTDTSRVLALNLSGSIAATVWGLGLGDTLVGRDVSTELPGSEKLPIVTTDGHSLNAEAVLSLRPSLVITDGSIGPRDVVEQLSDAGVAVVFVDNAPSFAGATVLAREVAAIYGTPAAGERLAAKLGEELDAVRSEIARFVPRAEGERLKMLFLYLRGSSGVYYLFGEESGASDLIEGLGGIDVARKMNWTGMRPMTDEAIIAADPDLILVMTGGLKSTGGLDRLLADKQALALTTAGKRHRFVDMADGDVLSFGPRSAQVLEALARAIYAPESR